MSRLGRRRPAGEAGGVFPQAAGAEAEGSLAARADVRDRAQGSVRLDRRLGREGLGTRSELKKAIRAGRVLVNGAVERDPGRQVLMSDEILFDGERVGGASFAYFMLHKPAGVVTATEDAHARTVLDLLREPPAAGGGAKAAETMPAGEAPHADGRPVLRRGLFPVGRLDRDTEGLLLITDDGQLAHRLLSPRFHVDKTYYALVTGSIGPREIRQFAEGLHVDDGLDALPARLELAGPDSPGSVPEGRENGSSEVLVTIREGKYHQIKRMFAALGKEVLYLKRLSMGPLALDPSLAPGQFRPLTQAEIRALRRACGGGGPCE